MSGRQNLVPPSRHLRRFLLEDHGEGIGFLAAGRRRAPDAQALARGPRLAISFGSTAWRNRSKGLISRKKNDLIDRHRFRDFAIKRLFPTRPHGADQSLEIVQPSLARDRHQPAFQQIRLVAGQHEATNARGRICSDSRRHPASWLPLARNPHDMRRNLIERQDGAAQACGRDRPRHAPDDAWRPRPARPRYRPPRSPFRPPFRPSLPIPVRMAVAKTRPP